VTYISVGKDKNKRYIISVIDKIEGCFLWERQCSDSMAWSPMEIKITQWEWLALVFLGIWGTDFGFTINIIDSV